MAHTITEKILAAHTDEAEVQPGQIINARLDFVVGNDITAPLAIEQFERIGAKAVFDKSRIALVPDHYTPSRDIRSAQQALRMRQFAQEMGIENYFEVGRMGIEHALLPEQGLVVSGDCVIGADSHTCTYGALGAFSTGVGSTDFAAAMALGEIWLRVPESEKFILKGKRRPWVCGKDLMLHVIGLIGVSGALYRAMEFTGEVVPGLAMSDRFTMCNMAIEAGAKSGIFAPDDTTIAWMKGRQQREPRLYTSDPDAQYHKIHEIDCARIEPSIAFPPRPDNVKPLSQAGEVHIDQAVVGSCTNGWIEDMRSAAAVIKGRKVAPGVRMIVIPATQDIYRQCMKEGLTEIFVDAGAAVSTPTCGPCLGGHMGVLAQGERCISTTNRNFVGRMGHPESEVYLASPAVVAASAVLGRIAGPAELGLKPDEYCDFISKAGAR